MIMRSDLIRVEFDFGSTIEVAIILHHELEPFLTQLPELALVWYTDGSKLEQGSGIGIHGPKCRISLPLGLQFYK